MDERIVWNTEDYQPFAKVSQKVPKSLAFAKDYFCKRYNRSSCNKAIFSISCNTHSQAHRDNREMN